MHTHAARTSLDGEVQSYYLRAKMCIRDSVNTDMKYETFTNVCTEAWKDRYGFLVVDKDSSIDAGMYRAGFDHFIVVAPNN